jgi:RNA polymerase sigma-70 factor (ECF subfamily)
MRVHAEPDAELLLAHSAWIRSLARRLAGADADDLEQDTWLAALERPRAAGPRPLRAVRSVRGWLAGLVRNLARETRRGEGRRRARERSSASATGASEPSVAETFESVATGRELADLVLELEEPFRTAVLLRYYEDLPPRRIALKLGIPVRTVNSRLTRGLERLRERWKLRHGGGQRGDARGALAPPRVARPLSARRRLEQSFAAFLSRA